MAQIEMVMTVRDFSGELNKQLTTMFSNVTFPYEIFHTSLDFKPQVKCEIKTIPMRKAPAITVTDLQLSFYSDMAAEIDMDYNRIMYYVGPKNLSPSEISVPKLRKYIKHDYLDDDFEGQIDLLCLRMVHAIILTMPQIDIHEAHFAIYLNQKEFRSKNYITSYPINEVAYRKWSNLFKSNLSIRQTWNWLRQNNIYEITKTKCPAATLLSYLLNRDFHEILLYSVIGLEALYGDKKNRRSKSFTLQNRVHSVFPVISKEQIRDVYNARSRLSHGDAEIGAYNLILDLFNGNFNYDEEAILASAIFIETLRMLIVNNSVKLNFQEKLEVTFNFG